MTTTTEIPAATAAAPALRAIDCRWLLALYAVIPACLLLVAADALLGDSRLLHSLPADPMLWPFWTLVFGLPHIIASLLTMADREYISHYGKHLRWPLLVFIGIATAGYFGPQPISYQLLFVFFAFYTVYHVLAQQLGLTLMMMGTAPGRLFKAWKWLAVVTGFAIYINVYGAGRVDNPVIGPTTLFDLLDWLALALCATITLLALRLTPLARNRLGVFYLWANVAMLISALLINHAGYTLLVILIPRVIHDLTAYIVYISHDSNRNSQQPRNLIYRVTGFTRLPPLVLLPLLSILLAWLLSSHQHYPLIGITILSLSFLHYYMESFIWKAQSPHRQNLQFLR